MTGTVPLLSPIRCHGVDRESSLQIGCGPYRAYGVMPSPAANAEVRNKSSCTDGSNFDLDRMGSFSYVWENMLKKTYRTCETQ